MPVALHAAAPFVKCEIPPRNSMLASFWFSVQADSFVREWESLLTAKTSSQHRAWPLLLRSSTSRSNRSERHVAFSSEASKACQQVDHLQSDENESSYVAHNIKKTSAGAGQTALRAQMWTWIGLGLYFLPFVPLLALLLMRPSFTGWCAAVWLCAEFVFLVFHEIQKRKACRKIVIGPEPDPADIRLLLSRVLELKDIVDRRQFLSRWFHGAPFEQIKRGNMLEFIAYGFYDRHFHQLSARAKSAVQEHLAEIERGWELTLPEGFTKGLEFMAHNREPLRALHHPLVIYIWSAMVSSLTGLVLQLWGFSRQDTGCLTYYHKPAAPGAKSLQPRVFIHGLGIGVTPYLPFLANLLSNPYREYVVVELPHVAMRIVSRPPTMDDIAATLSQIHERHNLKPAAYIGHSYGSLVVARVRLLYPEVVGSIVLIDPVSLLLCLPDVIHNFIYRKPDGPNTLMWFLDWLRWYLCSRELYVAQALCRNFNWGRVMLWPNQLPKQAVVMLAAKDTIVPSPEIQKQMKKHDVKCIWNEGMQHAEFLFHYDTQTKLLEAIDW